MALDSDSGAVREGETRATAASTKTPQRRTDQPNTPIRSLQLDCLDIGLTLHLARALISGCRPLRIAPRGACLYLLTATLLFCFFWSRHRRIEQTSGRIFP